MVVVYSCRSVDILTNLHMVHIPVIQRGKQELVVVVYSCRSVDKLTDLPVSVYTERKTRTSGGGLLL